MASESRSHDRRTGPARQAVAALLAAVFVSGCAGLPGLAWSSRNADPLQRSPSGGLTGKAVRLAERAVLASPRDAARRARLGSAYLKAGRFASATEAFDDALELGEESVATVLGLALAEIARGHDQAALGLLNDWRDVIPATDLGLALALAGEAPRGVAVLTDAIRGGDRTARVRQNLAFAFALAGYWREARLMMVQDVPADQVPARIREWAQLGTAEARQARVARLLDVPLTADLGQPAALALTNFPGPAAMTGQVAAQPQVERDSGG